jgi:CHAT domain-containing protein
LIANDLLSLGRGAEAAVAAAVAARVADETDSALLRAGALNAAGRAQLLAGNFPAATADLERAAAIFAGLGMRAERAQVLHGLSLAARGGGQFDAAVAHGDEALRELEQLRERVADPELRALFVAARRDYYDAQIDLWMRGAPQANERTARAALQVNERSRARMTAELLQEGSIDLRRSADPALLARERSLYTQLAELRNRRDMAAEHAAQPVALERVVGQLTEVENALNLLEIELRRSDPRLAAVAAPRALTTEEMQARLDDDTVLLQYALGDEASYVWAVSREAVAVTPLAARATIEAAASRALAGLQNFAAGAAPSSELAELAALVLDPVAPRLGKRRVVLALDGALQYVPFGVLPLRGSEGVARALLESHEVVEIPSLSALTVASRDSSRATKTLAVFADPVLEASDPRLGGAPMTALLAATNERVRSAGASELGRLLSSGYEAEAIAALVPDDRVVLARGFAANRDAVLGTELADFRYIHFATHGLVDARYPGLSALVLSRFDDRGNAQDGFLRLSDIYNLNLDADLVVLSACETALGREVRGEGLIGLTQGFMAAGARSLVASLWRVPDRATAELMAKFYGFMLNDGMRPAEALRAAQLWSAAQPRTRHPYFWGGFVLVGDWR